MDTTNDAQKARAKRLHDQIEELVKREGSAPGKQAPDADPSATQSKQSSERDVSPSNETSRDFIERRMREIGKASEADEK